MSIHPTAIIDPTAVIGENVELGPYSIIGPHCQVGDGAKIAPHAVLEKYVKLGRNCQVATGAVLGGAPQDLKFKGEESWVIVGDDSVIRECVTINRSSGEGTATTLGSKCMLMAYTHLGHNCQVGDEVIIANAVQLGGHVEVGDGAFIGGTGAYHQFIRIGKLAIISGFSAARQDVPPFAMAASCPAEIVGINKVGLKRRGFDLNARTRIKKAYQLLFFSQLNTHQAIEAVRAELGGDPHIDELVAFVESSKRGICRATAGRRHAAPGMENQGADILAEVF